MPLFTREYPKLSFTFTSVCMVTASRDSLFKVFSALFKGFPALFKVFSALVPHVHSSRTRGGVAIDLQSKPTAQRR